jgi:maleylacetate reductase
MSSATVDSHRGSMRAFICNLLPGRVIFGSGTLAQVADEAARLEMRRVLVVSTAGRVEWASAVARSLGDRYQATFSAAAMHTPVEVTDAAMRVVSGNQIDGIVAVGGGSTIGLAKAIALRTDLNVIVVPTTYAGSEVTPVIGETRNGIKETQRSARVLPEVVIYDVDLTLGLPPQISGASGMNAIAHAVEALYAQDGSPFVRLIALEAVRTLASALPQIVKQPRDYAARSAALYGAWLCGMCLAAVTMALHHKICHVLGGSFALPHAQTHAIILPYVVAYNSTVTRECMQELATALGHNDAAEGIRELALTVGAPVALKDIGMSRADIDAATDLVLARPGWNPRPVERDALRSLMERAYQGASLYGQI